MFHIAPPAMSVSQAEYAAKMAEISASIAELVQGYSQISLQAAPWSNAISAEVAASEAKASGALAEVRALHDITKTEVEDLRRRATELEKKSSADRKAKWEMSRPKDLVLDVFGGKEEQWPKFREQLKDYA